MAKNPPFIRWGRDSKSNTQLWIFQIFVHKSTIGSAVRDNIVRKPVRVSETCYLVRSGSLTKWLRSSNGSRFIVESSNLS